MKSGVSPRILIASGVGLVLVLGAYFISLTPTNTLPDSRRTVVAGPAPQREFIEVADHDNDGTADWKQTLPESADWLTRDDVASTTATAAITHTEAIAIQTLQRMMNANMYPAFGDSSETIAEDTHAYVAALATDDLYTEDDIVILSDASETTLRTYGNTIAEITYANSIEKEIETETTILNKAVSEQNPQALADLDLIATSYEGMRDDTIKTPVPRTYVKEHLDLINTYNALAIDVRAMEQVFTDPLYALIRIQRYEDDTLGFYTAVKNLFLKFEADGITWSEDDVVTDFLGLSS